MKEDNPRVLDVGQCDFDHANISRMLSKGFGAEVKQVATREEALRAVQNGHFDLVLVNRILDVDGASGLDLIRQLQSDEVTRDIPVVLVSDFADAQDAAVVLGAKRGFGKNALADTETHDCLAELLGRDL